MIQKGMRWFWGGYFKEGIKYEDSRQSPGGRDIEGGGKIGGDREEMRLWEQQKVHKQGEVNKRSI